MHSLRRKTSGKVKDLVKQDKKFLLILTGILIGLVILEISLQSVGFFLSKEKSPEDVQNRTIILCFGESTTASGFPSKGAWPEILEDILNNNEDRFKVYNLAVPGTNTAIIASEMQYNIDRYSPDIIITMMGINDNGVLVFRNPIWKKESFFDSVKTLKVFNYIYTVHIKEKREKYYYSKADGLSLYNELGDDSKQKKALRYYEIIIRNNPINPRAYGEYARIASSLGYPEEKIQIFLDKYSPGVGFSLQENVTGHNYREIYDIISSRRIQLIVMQYPLKDIDEMYKLLPEEEIIFISNKENFKKALEENPYEFYFKDQFAIDFGHTTKEGHNLIAENVARYILNYTRTS